ncbi:MAG: hypothetical protein GKS02_11615 [Alphaproteobacteria bacterium]|nr:hypothetical protein [Alphaproteobacteria bacterium]
MIRFALIGIAALVSLHLTSSTATADPVADVGKLITECGAEQAQAKCAAQFWNFADLTGDSKLTVAEISRFFRLLVEHQANKAVAVAPPPGTVATPVDPFEAVAVTFFVGPVAASLVIDNFDYNGSRTIEREEVFADIDEGAFTKFVFEESKKLPERAGTLMLRALQAGAAVRGPQ